MCIVSLVQFSENHFILTHNRDENINRLYSNTLIEEKINNTILLFPKDFESNGTWIFSSKKYIVCLLNGANEKHIRQISYKKSRGNLVLDITHFSNVSDFAKSYNFKNYESFTLYIIDIETQKKKILVWDEEQLHIEDISQINHSISLSSTLYTNKQKKDKKKLFRKYLKSCHTKKDLLDWHFANRMIKNTNYPNIQTVCITQIEVINTQIFMNFIPNIDNMDTI